MTSLLDRVQPVGDIPAYPKLLIHSGPGDGKTTFAAGAPNPVWIDFERSFEALRYVDGGDKIPVFIPQTFVEVMEFVPDAIKKYDTLVFDTVSSMQVMYMHEYMKKETLKPDGTQKPNRSIYLPFQGDYRYATNELTQFWLMLQQAPVNVIFCAHSKIIYKKDDKGADTTTIYKIIPLLSPAVGESLRQFINVVAYLEVEPGNAFNKEVKRRLYVNKTDTIMAKNRLGLTEQSIENPTFKGVFK